MNVRAVVKNGPGPGFDLVDLEAKPLGSRDVLVEIEAAAICGTDLHIYDWNAWAAGAGLPESFIVGHEFSGRVVAVGDAVRMVKPGDKVSAESHVACGQCYQCLNGLQHICGNLKVIGVHTDGCWAEYAVVPECCARPIPGEIDFHTAAIMEPLGTSIRCAQLAEVSGNTVVVTGCGPIGLGAIAAAQAFGAANIVATDIVPSRMELGQQMGATHVLHGVQDDVGVLVRELTQGVGADAVIECSGNIPALQAAFKYLRKGGRVVLVGLPSQPLTLDVGPDLAFKEATVRGVHGRRMYETWQTMESLLVKGLIDPKPIITHVLPMAEYEDGIHLCKSGEGCKVLLLPK